MRIFIVVLVVMVIAPLSVARAENCSNAVDQATMNRCADEAYKKTDTELNAIYKQILVRLNGNDKTTKLLVAAQKTWLSFRDAECAFATSASVEGSVYPMLVSQCRDGLTRKRIDALNVYLECAEGDLGCPVPPK